MNKMEQNILFWIGETQNPIKKERHNDRIMDSIINYLKSKEPQLPYKAKEVFLDNGAFTARMKKIQLDVNQVLDLQERLHPSKVIPLDYPYLPGDSTRKMKRLWEKTKENILLWQDSSTLGKKLVPTVHAWSMESLEENIRWTQKFVDSDFISFGSIVTGNFETTNYFFGDRHPSKELITMLFHAIEKTKELSDFKVHVLGIGSSPLMLSLIYYLGAESTDSAGARRKAAYGKIILPGTGERYLGDGTARFGRNIKNDENESKIITQLHETCNCEVCRTNPSILKTSWKARAKHNEHVLKQEVQTIERLLSQGREVLERYMDGIFERSSLNYLYKLAKQKIKFHSISVLI